MLLPPNCQDSLNGPSCSAFRILMGLSWKQIGKAQTRYQPSTTGGTGWPDGHCQSQCWRHQDQERAGESKLLWIWCEIFFENIYLFLLGRSAKEGPAHLGLVVGIWDLGFGICKFFSHFRPFVASHALRAKSSTPCFCFIFIPASLSLIISFLRMIRTLTEGEVKQSLCHCESLTNRRSNSKSLTEDQIQTWLQSVFRFNKLGRYGGWLCFPN